MPHFVLPHASARYWVERSTTRSRHRSSPADGKTQAHNGQAASQGLIPIWLIAAAALVLVCIFCSSIWLITRSGSNSAHATQTAQAMQMNQIVQATLEAVTKTAQASGATQSAQSAAATQTALAIQFTQMANATFSACDTTLASSRRIPNRSSAAAHPGC